MEKVNDVLSRIKIPVGSHGKHQHRFSFPIVETADWMTPMPIYTRELRKGDSIKFKSSLFGRTDALLNPAFVTGQYHYRFFFVPYRLIQPSYYYMMLRDKYQFPDGSTVQVPTTTRFFNMKDFMYSFAYDTSLCEQVASPLSNPYDFVLHIDSQTDVWFKMKDAGVRVFQLMRGLGYGFTWDVNDRVDTPNRLDALPVLSWLTIFRDWLFPDQYAQIHTDYFVIDRLIRDNQRDFEVSVSNLLSALKISTFCYYLDDTLTSVWDSPSVSAGVGTSIGDSFAIKDITLNTDDSVVVSDSVLTNDTPVIVKDSNAREFRISQYILNVLSSVNNWMQRNKLAGGRVLQRYLAQHGVPMPNSSSETCYALSHKSLPLQIGDVENNSNTNTGELAGKGIVRTGNGDFISCDYSADEDGLFVLMRYVMPDARLPMVQLPQMTKIDCLNRFHSEFQKLGVEAVGTDVVFTSENGLTNSQMNSTFGFLPRYWFEAAEFPRLLGDFEIRSRGAAQLAQYHTFRKIETSDVVFGLHHSYDFVKTADRNRYNRIFYTGSGASNFRNFMFCSVVLVNDKLPIGDSFDWDDDELNKRVELISKSNV